MKLSETQTVILTLRAREEEYKAQIAHLTDRVRALEEEIQSRLIDSEDVH